jgi:low affinity Fe/Cu permease
MPGPISVRVPQPVLTSGSIASASRLAQGCAAQGEAGMSNPFEKFATRIAALAGRPPAFILALLVIVTWALTGPIFRWSDTWQLVINTGTTIVTFLMVFLIQNTQNRGASAIQAKLDELIRAQQGARNEFIGIEHLTEMDLQAILQALERTTGNEKHKSAAIARLIRRR